MTGSFNSWCQNANIYTKDTNECTHLILTGGKLKITAKTFEDFIRNYTIALKQNESLHLVERVSHEINLFLDIDCKRFPTFNYKKLVDDIRLIIPEKTHVYKCDKTDAYHVVYPDIQISPEKAVDMVKLLQNKLVANYYYKANEIQDIIDTSVYKTGLRMIGSYKKGEERSYLPIGVKRREDITEQHIRESLIRNSHQVHVRQSDSRSLVARKHYDLISKEIGRLHSNYRDIQITRIERKSNDLFFINTYSHFCMNKCGYHDNYVYFVVSKGRVKKAGIPSIKIYQKCFCTNNDTSSRLEGVCSKFKSREYPFSHNVFNELIQET